MKIAFLFDKYPHLTETFLAREVAALRKLGLEVEIFAFEAGQGARQIPFPPMIFRLARDKKWQMRGQLFARMIADEGFTHIHAAWANHVSLAAMEAAKSLGLPWSFSAHARDLWVEGGNLQAKLGSAKFAFVCTRAGETRLRELGKNVIYAPHGLPLADYKWREWKGENKWTLLGVGRLVEKKGWRIAVNSLDFLPQGVELKIIGDGPLRSELPPQYLAGARTHAEVIREMQNASCLILPSIQTPQGDRDGLANVILEAAALGLPVLTTNAGSAGDFVDDNTGWLCESTDARAFARAVEAVFAQPDETRRRCLNARRRVENEFDSDQNARALARAFNSIAPFFS